MINKNVYEVTSKNQTNDPFIICENNDIRYLYGEDLSSEFKAVYIELDKPTIIINAQYKYNQERYFIVAHELYHALYHNRTLALYHNGYNAKDKSEREANEFATKLLLSGYQIDQDETKEMILKRNYIPGEMIRYI
ncbi:MAG: ImmA/IrrE family metallo-endopeptidase [Aerococcus suis]|nr:ImmA/IrrE family metallo-endopeptidase [Aerococcus suis]